MEISDRIIQYIEFKGFTKYRFYKDTGLSNGFLDKKGNIGSDKCEIICNQYPDLNVEWLLTGKGDMIKKDSINTLEELADRYTKLKKDVCRSCIEKDIRIAELKETISVQKDLIHELKKQRDYYKDAGGVGAAAAG